MSAEVSGEPQKESLSKRLIKLLVKITVTAFCFWYISRKIDFSETFLALREAKLAYLLAAFFFFLLSKLLSAFRLQVYFKNIGLQVSHGKNIRLYLLGMYYNLFLPGAISGDAYKVVLLNRRYQVSYKKGSSAVLLDRFSGVLALGMILSIYGIAILEESLLKVLLLAGSLLAIGGWYLVVRFWFRDFLPGFFSTFTWGFGVQLSQVICIYLILFSLGIPVTQHEWILIFLAAAVVSILPLSLGGGLGTRELVFAEGARVFELDPQTGVVISLLFYFLTVAGSLPGLYFVFRDPLKD